VSLELVPVTLAEANAYVRQFHRHHGPVQGARFCVGVADGFEQDEEGAARIVGVAIIGRPVARHLDDGWTLEVNRACHDGHRNAGSMLYAAAWRAVKALGYHRLITYTLPSESGASLRGAGWRVVAEIARSGDQWSTPSRPRVNVNPRQERLRWEAV
jgi:hypothetical protein